jgi:hypothetical protein
MSDPDQIRASIEQTAPNSATTRTPGGQGHPSHVAKRQANKVRSPPAVPARR